MSMFAKFDPRLKRKFEESNASNPLVKSGEEKLLVTRTYPHRWGKSEHFLEDCDDYSSIQMAIVLWHWVCHLFYKNIVYNGLNRL